MSQANTTPVKRIWRLISTENKNIRFLYAYAIFSGAISLIMPLGIQALMSMVIGGRLSSSWLLLVFFIAGGVLLTGITRLAQISILENMQQRMFAAFAMRFAHVLGKANLVPYKSGHHVLSEKFLDIITLQKSFTKLILDLSASVLQILFGLILLLLYHPAFLFFDFSVIVIVLLILRATWNSGIKTSRTESDYKFRTAHWINEITRNKSIFRLQKKDPFHLRKTEQLLNGYIDARKKHFKVLYRQSVIAIILKIVFTVSLIVLGSYLLLNESISLGQFLASEILIITLLNALEKLIVSVENVYDSGIALEKLGSVADHAESEMEFDFSETSGKQRGISIRIADQEHNNQVTVQHGEKIGICAVPGSGRTWLLKAILGEDQDKYKISVNDIPAKQIPAGEMGKYAEICFQSSDLFDGTIAENITLNSDLDYGRLKELGDLLGLNDFIHSVDDGWNHYINADDLSIPNNTIRKILLTRALYSGKELILIDDIWSVFRKDEIVRIIKYINSLNCTAFIVSNFAPVLEQMDKVIHSHTSGIKSLEISELKSNPELMSLIWS